MISLSFRASVLCLLLFVAIQPALMAESPKIPPPDQKGPFNVGFQSYEVFGLPIGDDDFAPPDGNTLVWVWYPVDPTNQDVDCKENPSDPSCVTYPGWFPGIPLESPLGARVGLPVAQGKFPLVVHQHGYGSSVPEQISVMENLVSHGFIAAAYNINDTFDPIPLICLRALDFQAIIGKIINPADQPLGKVFASSIDINKIGASGLSFGGYGVLSAATGNSFPPDTPIPDIPPDTRIKSLFLMDPYIDLPNMCDYSAAERANLNIPYLVISGSNFYPIVGTAVASTLFEETTNVSPRTFADISPSTHYGFVNNLCEFADKFREMVLGIAVAEGILIKEPLILGNNEPTGDPVLDEMMGVLGYLWTINESPTGISSPYRTYCDSVGVSDSSLRSLDVNPMDGITDISIIDTDGQQKLLRDVSQGYVTERQTTEFLKLYSVAFWKVYLENDGRYQPFLTPGYAVANDLRLKVYVTGGNGGKQK
jgi:hypothetical protein